MIVSEKNRSDKHEIRSSARESALRIQLTFPRDIAISESKFRRIAKMNGAMKAQSTALAAMIVFLVLPAVLSAQESAARRLQSDFNAVVEDVLPVVVEVNVVRVVQQEVPQFSSPFEFFFGRPDTEEREFRRGGLGSGVIVRRDGDTVYVLSNNHVVGNADEISIVLSDGREFDGSIVGADERTDRKSVV